MKKEISESAIKTSFAQAVRNYPELYKVVSELAENSRRSFLQMTVYLVEIGLKSYKGE